MTVKAAGRSLPRNYYARYDRTIMPERTVLTTSFPRLRLVDIRVEDADAVYHLIVASRAHLTQHGDWIGLVEATPQEIALDLQETQTPPTRFGL